jgi:hypothetical protein
MYGLLCVSNLKEECLSNTIDIDADQYSGTVITINFNTTSLSTFFIGGGIVIDNITATNPTDNVILTDNPRPYRPFDVSIINVLSSNYFTILRLKCQFNILNYVSQFTKIRFKLYYSSNAYY